MMQRLANNEGPTNLRWGPRYLYGTVYIVEHVFLRCKLAQLTVT